MSKTLSWKQRLSELDSMAEATQLNAWKTARHLRALMKESGFTSHCGGSEQAEAKLGNYAGMFCMELHQMLQVFEYFPRQSDWTSRSLRELVQETYTQLQKRRKTNQPTNGNKKPKQRNNPIPSSIHDKVVKERDYFEKRASELDELKKQNAELLEENAVLKGRVQELERLVDKHFGVANA